MGVWFEGFRFWFLGGSFCELRMVLGFGREVYEERKLVVGWDVCDSCVISEGSGFRLFG